MRQAASPDAGISFLQTKQGRSFAAACSREKLDRRSERSGRRWRFKNADHDHRDGRNGENSRVREQVL